MLDEQKHLLEVAEALTARLEYFRELERAVRLLNEPGEEVVLRPEFLEALDRLGVCLEYLRANVRPAVFFFEIARRLTFSTLAGTRSATLSIRRCTSSGSSSASLGR